MPEIVSLGLEDEIAVPYMPWWNVGWKDTAD